MIGLVGLLVLNAKNLSDFVKENINFTIVLKPEVREIDMVKLQKELDDSPFVKSTEYVTREKAAKEFAQTLGEDFVGVLGYNPLNASIEVKLYAQYANQDSISKIDKYLKNNSLIQEVVYEKSLIQQVNKNVKKISLIILGFSGFLLFIAIALINNVVRLLMYSKRFIIRTMQLVGAAKGFVRRPFLYRSLWHGLIASIIAIILMCVLLYYIRNEFPDLLFFTNYEVLTILFSGIAILGIFLNLICSFFAINKYLNLDIDKLY
jgi:cell division transport system permease protein